MCIRDRLWGVLPFIEAAPDTLADVLRTLAMHPSLREAYAARGMAHFDNWHREDAVAQLLLAVYAGAGRTTRRLVLQEG